jgi:hypothetical protein
MSDATLNSITEDPDTFSVQIADQIESFLVSVGEIAKGDDPDSAVPYLLLELSQLILAGGRLGAHEDFVPAELYEPDIGPEPDVDEMRLKLLALLDPVDVYSEVFDPYEPRSAPVACRISDDLAAIVTDLRHGMAHYRSGRPARRCGGGSSPTCRTGGRRPRPPCEPFSRWWRTSGWAPRSPR